MIYINSLFLLLGFVDEPATSYTFRELLSTDDYLHLGVLGLISLDMCEAIYRHACPFRNALMIRIDFLI